MGCVLACAWGCLSWCHIWAHMCIRLHALFMLRNMDACMYTCTQEGLWAVKSAGDHEVCLQRVWGSLPLATVPVCGREVVGLRHLH